ncbi:MAG: RNA polymerase sigma factor [Dysgonamonadaceae bacterium]|jgi:RNA polymerase sigma-70 factor (ECF subfamily)|nr:RNA polymerase sigma factor [Dysgonamonadaceae bacterium]
MEQEQFKKEILPLRDRLLSYAQRLLGNKDDAEDVVQEVFFKLWLMRADLDKYDYIPAFSLTITKHLSLNQLKKYEREYDSPDENMEADDISPYTGLEQKDELEQLLKIVNRLPDLQQSVLRMKHIDGLETDEIAALTGSSPEAVRMNLSRARKKVRDWLLDKGGYNGK